MTQRQYAEECTKKIYAYINQMRPRKNPSGGFDEGDMLSKLRSLAEFCAGMMREFYESAPELVPEDPSGGDVERIPAGSGEERPESIGDELRIRRLEHQLETYRQQEIYLKNATAILQEARRRKEEILQSARELADRELLYARTQERKKVDQLTQETARLESRKRELQATVASCMELLQPVSEQLRQAGARLNEQLDGDNACDEKAKDLRPAGEADGAL